MAGIDFVAYVVTEYKDKEGQEKSNWREIGRGTTGKESITVYLDAFPVNGKLVLLKPKPKEAKEKLDPFGGGG